MVIIFEFHVIMIGRKAVRLLVGASQSLNTEMAESIKAYLFLCLPSIFCLFVYEKISLSRVKRQSEPFSTKLFVSKSILLKVNWDDSQNNSIKNILLHIVFLLSPPSPRKKFSDALIRSDESNNQLHDHHILTILRNFFQGRYLRYRVDGEELHDVAELY